MNSANYERGSEWRKWDLHVHTPFSLVHNYKSKNDDDVWERYIKDLEALPSEFKVLGINDYLFIDGYKRVLEYKKQGRLQNINLILPVIELRIAKFCGNRRLKRINYHIIFSEEISPDIIQAQFLNGLTTSYKLDADCNQIPWSGLITKENLQELGKKIKESVPKTEIVNYESDLIEGFNNLNLDVNDILKTLKNGEQYFKGKYLTCIGKTEWDMFNWNDSSIAEKKTIINSVDVVFTAAESIEKYNNGKNKLKESNVNDLLLDCSDAHYNIDSIEKDRIGNCNTWIKADTTFEGLKQIIYEPDERLKIQEVKPDYKNDSAVIESIVFHDNDFQEMEIKLNTNLISIIGSRSSGKSTLLRSIANAIDKEQSKENCGNDWENLINPKIDVKWANDDEDIFDKNTEYGNHGKKIIYIPQNFLSSQTMTEDPNSFAHKTIQDILKKNNKYKFILDNVENETNIFKSNITKEVDKLFSIEIKLNDIQKDIDELGNKDIITKEIEKLDNEYNSIQSSEQINESDKKLQIDLTEENQKIIEDIKKNRHNFNLLNKLNNDIDIEIYGFDKLDFNNLSVGIYNTLIDELSIAKNIFIKIVKDKIEENILTINYDYECLCEDLKSKRECLNSINEKINLSESAQIILERLNNEKIKLKNLITKTQEFDDIKINIKKNWKNYMS
ncbi:hypothetical protein [Methanobrevibacter arboriphilus]|uniref:hypothetical protein n=1 Tax=Methanobrevibacter arboriphilus TaxID=39441 RepID=UPI0006946E29|nr:hypothetical protein [Methanobrevibacter arboriphilus]